MLTHHNYFATLASLGDTNNSGWHETVAGLVTLRLIDDWLDSGRRKVAPDKLSLSVIRDLLAQVPAERPVKPLLERIVRAVENESSNQVEPIAPHVISYSQHLTDDGQLLLAHDAILPLHHRAVKAKNDTIIVKTSLRLARIFRHSSMYETAIEYYNAAIFYARRIGDIHSQLKALTGLSKVLAVRGDLSGAFSLCADAVVQAEATQDFSMLGTALQDQGFAAYLAGDIRTALVYCSKGLKHLKGIYRECLLADMASMSSKVGDISIAAEIDSKLSVSATMQITRNQAALNLMHTAISEGKASAFELYRNGMQFATMEPWTRMWYWRLVTDGHLRFGNKPAADTALQSAYAIATEHDINPGCLVY